MKQENGPVVDIHQVVADMITTSEATDHIDPDVPRRARSNQISQIGHICLRYLALDRTSGEKKTPFNAATLRKFQRGYKCEEWAKVKLRKDFGEQVQDIERVIEIEKSGISGRIDVGLRLEPDNHRSPLIPIEIKSTTMFDQLLTAEHIKAGRFQRKWYYQIQSQMLALNVDGGIVMLVDPESYDYRYVPISLDYVVGDEILEKGEMIEMHLRAGTLPDKINHPHECVDCRLAHVCAPDLNFENSMVILNEGGELENDIRRKEELKAGFAPEKKEHDALDRKCKKSLNVLFDQNEGATEIAIGEILVGAKVSNRKGYVVEPTSYRTFKYA